jgi:hypothetical protein
LKREVPVLLSHFSRLLSIVVWRGCLARFFFAIKAAETPEALDKPDQQRPDLAKANGKPPGGELGTRWDGTSRSDSPMKGILSRRGR